MSQKKLIDKYATPSSTSSAGPAPAEVQQTAATLGFLLDEIGKVIVGQQPMTRSLVMGLVTGGHILLEGLPGLAKTLTVRTLAQAVHTQFHRIQFTPDLLPSDLIGTMIYDEKNKEFFAKKGPIFANIVLADEINRAPAKVQSALLEAMAEHQVTIGDKTFPLSEPFLVLATQNPIEQEGTYNLPEAQLDRFMFKVRVDYPSRAEEQLILERMHANEAPAAGRSIQPEQIMEARRVLESIYVDDRIKQYILRLVMATRKTNEVGKDEAKMESIEEMLRFIQVGASPRATLFLSKAARAHALLEGRHFVTPDDVKAVAREILRHRLILTFEADAKNITTDDIITKLLESVYVP